MKGVEVSGLTVEFQNEILSCKQHKNTILNISRCNFFKHDYKVWDLNNLQQAEHYNLS